MRVASARPPHSSLAPLASASSISALQRSTVLMATTEPGTTGPLHGSPRDSRLALAARRAVNRSAILLSTMIRSVDRQLWPALAKEAKAAALTAASISASSRMISGALVTKFTTPGGKPASCLASMKCDRRKATLPRQPRPCVCAHLAGPTQRPGSLPCNSRRRWQRLG